MLGDLNKAQEDELLKNCISALAEVRAMCELIQKTVDGSSPAEQALREMAIARKTQMDTLLSQAAA
jgi:hypothetical protein